MAACVRARRTDHLLATCWRPSPAGRRPITRRCWPAQPGEGSLASNPRPRGLQAGGLDQKLGLRHPAAQEPDRTTSGTMKWPWAPSLVARRWSGRLCHGDLRGPAGAAARPPSAAAEKMRGAGRAQPRRQRLGATAHDHQDRHARGRRHTLAIDYVLENLPRERPFHFGVEFNLAGLPARRTTATSTRTATAWVSSAPGSTWTTSSFWV